MRSPAAASQIGTSGAGGWPRRNARAAGVTDGRARSPASSPRTWVVTSRSRAAGRSYATSCHPSASWRVLAPRPSTNRPPESRCRVAAVIAIVAGERPQTENTPAISLIRRVVTASSASTTAASSPHPSATENTS